MIWLTFQVPRNNPTCRVFLCGLPCLISVSPPRQGWILELTFGLRELLFLFKTSGGCDA